MLPIILMPSPGPGNGCLRLISFINPSDLPKLLLRL